MNLTTLVNFLNPFYSKGTAEHRITNLYMAIEGAICAVFIIAVYAGYFISLTEIGHFSFVVGPTHLGAIILTAVTCTVVWIYLAILAYRLCSAINGCITVAMKRKIARLDDRRQTDPPHTGIP